MSAENLRFVVALSLRFALPIMPILYAKKSNRPMWLRRLVDTAINGLWEISFMWLPNWDRHRKETNKAAPAAASLLVAVVALIAVGTAVAQQQTQKPELHGFKARLCGMTTVPYSPAWDKCMAAGFGHPKPSQLTQPAAAPQPQVALQPQMAPLPQVAPPLQMAPQPQVALQPQVAPLLQTAPQPQAVLSEAKPQEPIVKDTPVQTKTCIEYMTTASGAQTCLRLRDDQNQ